MAELSVSAVQTGGATYRILIENRGPEAVTLVDVDVPEEQSRSFIVNGDPLPNGDRYMLVGERHEFLASPSIAEANLQLVLSWIDDSGRRERIVPLYI